EAERRGVSRRWRRAGAGRIAVHLRQPERTDLARDVQGALETEEKQEIDARALDAAERRARGHRLRVREGRTQAENPGQVGLDGRLVVWLRSELPAESRDEARRDLLTDRDLRPHVAELIAGLDLQDVEADLRGESSDERRRQEAGRERSGSRDQLLLLQRREV